MVSLPIGSEQFQLPPSLQRSDDMQALARLTAYYGRKPGEPGFFTGSLFDTWDSTGGRDADANVFTADDLVASSFFDRLQRLCRVRDLGGQAGGAVRAP